MTENLDELRAQIAEAKGLPPELAERLQGETEDELSADAENLLALVVEAPSVPQASRHQGQPEHQPRTPAPSMNDRLRAAAYAALRPQRSGYINGPDPTSMNDRFRRALGYTKETK